MVEKIYVEKKTDFDEKYWVGKTPLETHYGRLVKNEADVYYGGLIVASYRKLPPTIKGLLRKCCSVAKCSVSSRTRGVKQISAVFGALPRVAIREDYCRFSSQTKAQPEVFYALVDVGRGLWGLYKHKFPSMAHEFEEYTLNNIGNDWKKTGTPFTTININKNFAIGYHKDKANVSGVYSNVIISKENTKGGYFVCPEFDIAFEQSDGYLLIVDGVNILHGVTNIIPTKKIWSRSSVVFYTLKALCNCYPKEEEISRQKKVTTERARKRAL